MGEFVESIEKNSDASINKYRRYFLKQFSTTIFNNLAINHHTTTKNKLSFPGKQFAQSLRRDCKISRIDYINCAQSVKGSAAWISFLLRKFTNEYVYQSTSIYSLYVVRFHAYLVIFCFLLASEVHCLRALSLSSQDSVEIGNFVSLCY